MEFPDEFINNEKVVPFLHVENGEKSASFYCNYLGFKKEWVYQATDTGPRCVCVTYGSAKLYLSEFDETGKENKIVIWVDDLTPVIEFTRKSGVDAEIKTEGTHFGTPEVILVDPDRNDIVFSERPEDGP